MASHSASNGAQKHERDTTSDTDKSAESGPAKKHKAGSKDDFKAPSSYQTSVNFVTTLMKIKAEDFAIEGPKALAPIFVASREDKLIDVWKGLIDRNFLSVPVVSKEDNHYYGFLDIMDIVQYLVTNFAPRINEDRDFWDLVKEEKKFQSLTVKDVMTYPISARNPFHPVPLGYSAMAVVEPLGREHSLHRVAVIEQETRKLFNLVTQSQVITWLNKNLSLLGSIQKKPLSDCPSLLKSVISVEENSTAYDAFKLLTQKHISGVAVVDKSDKLTGAISLRDIKLLSHDARLFWRLQQTVHNFLVKLRHEFQERHKRPHRVVYATKATTLGEVIAMLAENGIHRVFIISDVHAKKPIGLVSLRDVVKELLDSI